MHEFEVQLLSRASMNIYADSTLPSFKNQLPQIISLEGGQRVALSEIFFPSDVNIYTDFFYHVYNIEGKEKLYEDDGDEENNEEEDVDKTSVGKKKEVDYSTVEIEETKGVLMYYQKIKMKPGQYRKISNVLFALYSKASWNMLQDGAYRTLEDGRVEFEFNANSGFTFPNRNIPNILGFRGRGTTFGIHVGNGDFRESRRVSGDFPNDLISGITLILAYTDLIEYQNTRDAKAPILRIVDSGICVNNGVVMTTQGLERRLIFDLQYKKLLVQNIQTISIQLRCFFYLDW